MKLQTLYWIEKSIRFIHYFIHRFIRHFIHLFIADPLSLTGLNRGRIEEREVYDDDSSTRMTIRVKSVNHPSCWSWRPTGSTISVYVTAMSIPGTSTTMPVEYDDMGGDYVIEYYETTRMWHLSKSHCYFRTYQKFCVPYQMQWMLKEGKCEWSKKIGRMKKLDKWKNWTNERIGRMNCICCLQLKWVKML